MPSSKGVGAVVAAMVVASGIAAAQSTAASARAKPLKRPLAAAPAPAPSWTLIDLGTLGGAGSYANALTNGGVVAGCSDVAGGAVHAFVYQSGVMRDLGSGSAADGNSCAYAANDSGVVAGRAASGDLVVWRDGKVIDLGVQGTVGGMNISSVVVGSYRDASGTHAFAWRDGTMQDLGNLGTNASSVTAANAINSRGQIVGNSNNHAFLYEQGTMRDLGTLGGVSSIAKGINDQGEIVGMAADEHGVPTPFEYSGTMRALPAPTYSAAIAINTRGQVIGSGEGIYGYLVDNGTVTRLDTLPPVVAKGWRHLEPTAINDRGWIAGTATTPSGDLRAFLLVPGGA
jgi:probable HAF family extracellular repeat protein